MKYEFKKEVSYNENDCWVLAILLLTNQDYDTVYNLLKPFVMDEGRVHTSIIHGYLRTKGYKFYDFHVSLNEALHVLDSSKGIVLELVNKVNRKVTHTVYVKDKCIHDNIEDYDSYFNNVECEGFYIKEES